MNDSSALPLTDLQAEQGRDPRQATAALALLALGVVYGDIGTSPLYAIKETFNPAHGIPLAPANILGGVSCIFWALMLVVTLKYVTLVLRANNRGEGGIMALLALATAAIKVDRQLRMNRSTTRPAKKPPSNSQITLLENVCAYLAISSGAEFKFLFPNANTR